MYQKFIINQEGILKFGVVDLHRDLLEMGETCPNGGGLWRVDEARRAILLYGRSFDFGKPDFAALRRIDWSSWKGERFPLFYVPHWPDEERLIPID